MPGRALASALAVALLLLGACGQKPAPTDVAAPGAPGVCRVGPDDGPVADKGIGGTGAPLVADRGIGGTGGAVLADRGIGGTGIIAVISGFASICLAGQEVVLPSATPITLGSEPASASQLRAGQVAVIDASDDGSRLSARRVSIRFEVSGPVETVDSDRLRVAGLEVTLKPATLGVRPAMGDWVAVSGIKRADGVIEATRLDKRAPGPVFVHGMLRRDGGMFHIGAMVLTPAPGLGPLLGRAVTVSGPLLLGRLEVESVTPDLLASDPAAFFGPAIGTVLIEGYAELGGSRLRLGQGLTARVAGPVTAGPQRGIYRFERDASGLRAVGSGPMGLAPTAGPAGSRGSGFAPAPMPNRSFSRMGASQDGVRRGDAGGPPGPDGSRNSDGRGPPDQAAGPGRFPGRGR